MSEYAMEEHNNGGQETPIDAIFHLHLRGATSFFNSAMQTVACVYKGLSQLQGVQSEDCSELRTKGGT